MCSIKRSGVFASLVLILFLSIPYVVFAYEEKIILSDEYQTPKEKERYKFKTEEVSFKDRFKLDLNFGLGGYYGGGYPQIYGIDPKISTYVNSLRVP